MSGEVLRELYVDLIARGVQQATDDARRVAGQFDEATKAVRRYRDAIADAGRATGVDGRVLSRGPGGVVTAARPATPAAGVTAAQTARPASAPDLAPALAQTRALTAQLGQAAAAAGRVGVALAPVIALVATGLGGTTELERFGQAMLQVGREVAGLVGPALRLGTDLLNQMTAAFRGTGTAGQLLLGRLSPLGVAFEVLADPAVQQSVRQLGAAFAQLMTAAQPLLNLLANVGSNLLRAFVVQPLTAFVNGLAVAVRVLERLVQLAERGARVAGLGRLMQAPAESRRAVTLNQTGTEDAQGTFQRIQEAVLRAGGGDEGKDPQLKELEKINLTLDTIAKTVEVALREAGRLTPQVSPADVAEGAKRGGRWAGVGVGPELVLTALFGR